MPRKRRFSVLNDPPRNSFENSDCLFKPVDDFSVFADFCCGNPDLDEYIHNEAQANDVAFFSRTYCLCLKSQDRLSPIVGFVALATDCIQLNNKEKKFFPNDLRYREYPAVKICRLAVRQENQRQNIGSYMVHVIRRFFLTENRVGCRFLTADVYNAKPVLHFYQKNGFEFLSKDDAARSTRTLYCDLLAFR